MMRAVNVTVDYPGVRALAGVTLEFRPGEIHAIIGENGAGKSTLMKVLSGSVTPTLGSLEFNGRPVAFAAPIDAIRAGVAMVHQELNLVPSLSVAENVTIGRDPTNCFGLVIDRQAQRQRARELLALLGANLNVTTLAAELSVAQGQLVEIAKCLASDARVLIFDEPTAVLSSGEVVKLMDVLRSLRGEGRSVVFVSHHLEEVVGIADRISVLRDGALVREFAQATDGSLRGPDGETATPDTLACAMVGRDLVSMYPAKRYATVSKPILELEDFGAASISNGISLSVLPGEILGIAGLVGSGRTETAQAIVGLRARQGVVRLDGRAVTFAHPRDAMRAGVVYVSEDRKGRGLHVSLSSVVNATLPTLDRWTKCCGLSVDAGLQREVTNKWIERLAIKCARPLLPIGTLSGGNQQKFALARWLESNPRVLIIDEPTRGVDVGARGEIYSILAGLAAQGMACIVISSDLPELIGLAHRIAVMREGEIVGVLDRHQLASPDADENIMRVASGVTVVPQVAQ